jgi:hypothetical protein
MPSAPVVVAPVPAAVAKPEVGAANHRGNSSAATTTRAGNTLKK